VSRRRWFVSVWHDRRESEPLKDGDFMGWSRGREFSEYFDAKTRGRAIALAIVASGFTGRVHAEVVERHRAKSSRQEMRRTAMYWGTRRERQAHAYRCLMGVMHDGSRR
jgi:hypothetical protein